MKNLNEMNCLALSSLEAQQINGGSTFWQDLASVGGAIVNGLTAFSTQAGKNAGLSVK